MVIYLPQDLLVARLFINNLVLVIIIRPNYIDILLLVKTHSIQVLSHFFLEFLSHLMRVLELIFLVALILSLKCPSAFIPTFEDFSIEFVGCCRLGNLKVKILFEVSAPLDLTNILLLHHLLELMWTLKLELGSFLIDLLFLSELGSWHVLLFEPALVCEGVGVAAPFNKIIEIAMVRDAHRLYRPIKHAVFEVEVALIGHLLDEPEYEVVIGILSEAQVQTVLEKLIKLFWAFTAEIILECDLAVADFFVLLFSGPFVVLLPG